MLANEYSDILLKRNRRTQPILISMLWNKQYMIMELITSIEKNIAYMAFCLLSHKYQISHNVLLIITIIVIINMRKR